MHWDYTFSLLLATLTGMAICIMALSRRSAPGALPLAVLGAAMAVWTLAYAAHFMAVAQAARLIWLKVTYLGVLTVPAAFLTFAAQYAGLGIRWRASTLALLAIEPLVTLGMIWWDPWGLFFAGRPPQSSILDGGPWFWVNVVYSYGLILLAVVLLVRAARRIPPGLRGQAAAILVGSALPWLTNLAGLLGVVPFPNLDLTPFAFTLSSLCFLFGLFHFRLFDILPIARDAIMNSLDEAILVLDRRTRLVDVNSTALKLMDWDGRPTLGLTPQEAFPARRELFDRFRETFEAREVIAVGNDPVEYFDVHLSRVRDRRGKLAGRMVVIRDITASRRMENKERELRTLAEALRDTAAALNSSHTFDEVVECLMDNVGRVVPHDMANFILLDDQGSARVERARGYRAGQLEEFKRNLRLPVDALPNFRKMIDTGRAILVSDTRTDVDWVRLERFNKVRSYVGAPVRVKGIIVGFLDLLSLTPGYFVQEHADRLQAFADQAAIAIENARLFEETQRRASEMSALLDVGLKMTASLELSQLLKVLLKKCMQILPVEVFYVATFDPETGLIQHPLFYDMGKHRRVRAHHIEKEPGLSGHVIQTRATLYLPDTFLPEVAQEYGIIRTGGKPSRSYLGVPLIAGDKVVGVISVQSYRKEAYNSDQIHLLQTIATQAAGFIENGRLYRKVQDELAQRKDAEHRYRALFEQSHDAVFIIDFEGRHTEVNRRAAEMLGYTVEEIRQLYVRDVSAESIESETVRQRLLDGDHIPLYERKFRRKDGEVITVEVNAELVRDASGKPLHIQSVVRDITARKQGEVAIREANQILRLKLAEIESLQTQLREQAIRDPLTGLFNRRYLEETLEREFESAKRSGAPVCLVMMDIDGFKGFNDRYGHDAGDYLLNQLGRMLQAEIRRSDICCRYGGEEFVVVMPGAPLDRGVQRAERLRSAFETSDLWHMGVKLKATLSLGVATYTTHGDSWERVLHAADRAMYAAKAAGRNCVRSAGD